ncbi:MAG: hypothetical protein WA056_08740 [Gallionella sp.]
MAIHQPGTELDNKVAGAELRNLIESLTGQPLPIKEDIGLLADVEKVIAGGQCIGYTQFNELLMNIGYDRVDPEFFQYLCDPPAISAKENGRNEISSIADLRNGITKFRELALLLYGNVKYGFKTLSINSERLLFFVQNAYRERPDSDYRSRFEPLVSLKKIEGKDGYLLGYISGNKIKQQLEKSPSDPELLKKAEYRNSVIEKGRWNHNVYLTSDHLDVYVATSMREQHEFIFVSDFIYRIEENSHLKDLKLRFFDPTQAYCENRIDKGLAEALMLKRAACTIYLAQESDTLGKDSELASTLAQGKPVIAFVPEMSDEFWRYLYETFRKIRSEESEQETLIYILQIYQPKAAWNDAAVREHLSGAQLLDVPVLTEKARGAVAEHYDKRASVLKDTHPLGLQTNLNTGVANGVLVARRIEDCAELVQRILLNKLEFDVIDSSGEDDKGYVFLKEKITKCTYRVMTGDRLLTNSFWNFY